MGARVLAPRLRLEAEVVEALHGPCRPRQAEDRPLLRRKRPRLIAGSFSFLCSGKPSDGRHWSRYWQWSEEEKRAEWEEMGDGGSAPSSFIAGECQPTPPRSQVMMVFPCMSQGLVKSDSCRGSVGKRRRPRPINRHTSTKAAGYWGPRHSALSLWLRLEAKPECALGPGATVGVLGTGVPRLACLWPTTWLC